MAKAQTKTNTKPATEVAAEPATKGRRTVVVTEQLQADYEELKALPEASKSSIIRGLTAKGYERGPIAKVMGILYQHVRNVQITPVKRKSEEKA